MKNDLPKNWSYSEQELEQAFQLSTISNDTTLISNVYAELNYLQFLGKSYSYWNLPDGMSGAFRQNYLVLCASVLESVLLLVYREKACWCRNHCLDHVRQRCAFFNRQAMRNRCRNASIAMDSMNFAELLVAARTDGLLNGVPEKKAKQLRLIRNQVHIQAMRHRLDEKKLTIEDVNGYLALLRTVLKSAVDQSNSWRGKCLKGGSQ